MPRLLFEKTGNAIWISHLDLMRLFQRAFKRGNIRLKHTQGFNPRPSVSIALPLSVGIESYCEILDFEMENVEFSFDEMQKILNDKMIEGVCILKVYDAGKKLSDLKEMLCITELEYDNGVPHNAIERIEDLFAQKQLFVLRKTKNGLKEQDIIPLINSIAIRKTSENAIKIESRICCQNPSLNPMQLTAAIHTYLPELTADFSKCRRIEIFDLNGNVFR